MGSAGHFYRSLQAKRRIAVTVVVTGCLFVCAQRGISSVGTTVDVQLPQDLVDVQLAGLTTVDAIGGVPRTVLAADGLSPLADLVDRKFRRESSDADRSVSIRSIGDGDLLIEGPRGRASLELSAAGGLDFAKRSDVESFLSSHLGEVKRFLDDLADLTLIEYSRVRDASTPTKNAQFGLIFLWLGLMTATTGFAARTIFKELDVVRSCDDERARLMDARENDRGPTSSNHSASPADSLDALVEILRTEGLATAEAIVKFENQLGHQTPQLGNWAALVFAGDAPLAIQVTLVKHIVEINHPPRRSMATGLDSWLERFGGSPGTDSYPDLIMNTDARA